MSAPCITCLKCGLGIPVPVGDGGGETSCTRCRVHLSYETFPSLFEIRSGGRSGDLLVNSQEASCFFHSDKPAAVVCEKCGRFLCALCDLEVQGKHLCPACFSSDRKTGSLTGLTQFRLSWAGVSFTLVFFFPLGLYPLTPIFALCGLFLLIVGLFRPGSITGRKKYFLFVITLLIIAVELVGSFFLGISMLESFYK